MSHRPTSLSGRNSLLQLLEVPFSVLARLFLLGDSCCIGREALYMRSTGTRVKIAVIYANMRHDRIRLGTDAVSTRAGGII